MLARDRALVRHDQHDVGGRRRTDRGERDTHQRFVERETKLFALKVTACARRSGFRLRQRTAQQHDELVGHLAHRSDAREQRAGGPFGPTRGGSVGRYEPWDEARGRRRGGFEVERGLAEGDE